MGAMAPIYLDYAASTPLLPEAWEAMRPWALRAGNAASSHAFGRAARQALDDARERIAACLDCDPDEVLFTSGATEANNLALFGLAGDTPGTLAANPLEHPCVTEPIQKLANRGWTATQLPVQPDGVVGPLPTSWPEDLRLATLMLANHETGAIQPVRSLHEALPAKVPLHCDAAAAVGKMSVSFRQLGVATLTLSGHKFHGPQGIGALLLKKGTRVNSLFFGGHQQHGKRPGTEAVALAVGLAVALEWACRHLIEHERHIRQLRMTLLDALRKHAAPVVVNGPNNNGLGLPHVLNVSFPGLAADALLMALDLAGVACSTGSACSSGSLLPSPVLQAMRVPADVLRSAMRFSFGPSLRVAELSEASDRIINSVNRLRQLASVGD
jgi:cysteine desulfurase